MNDNISPGMDMAEIESGFHLHALLSNRFTLVSSASGVRISFGESTPSKRTVFHSSVFLSREDALNLADLIIKTSK